MKLVKFGHLFFAALLSLYGLIGAANPDIELVVWWLGLFLYYSLIWGILKDNILCARIGFVPVFLVALWSLPMVIYNVYAFISEHPLYLDSPATIFVVGIYALFFTLPSLVTLYGYWLARQTWFVRRT